MVQEKKRHLPRLPAGHYAGSASVHWTMTIDERRTGWLNPLFLYQFRELLTHTLFRYRLTCPIYCLMPDHMHLLWMGLDDDANQLTASRFLRKHVNAVLEQLGYRFQHQAHDRVLRDNERQERAFEDLVEYIARNPERAGLVPADGYREYPYTDCLIPGYPELRLWSGDFWHRFWRVYSYQRNSRSQRGQQLET